jgi:hypothetical protein
MTYPTPPDLPVEDAAPPPPAGPSERSRGVALLLAVIGGPLALHRFYTGRTGSAVAMICTAGGLAVWWLYDVVMVATGEFRDATGRRVRRWRVADEAPGGARADELAAVIERLERQVAELAERVDFAERMLAQQRDRDRLPRA